MLGRRTFLRLLSQHSTRQTRSQQNKSERGLSSQINSSTCLMRIQSFQIRRHPSNPSRLGESTLLCKNLRKIWRKMWTYPYLYRQSQSSGRLTTLGGAKAWQRTEAWLSREDSSKRRFQGKLSWVHSRCSWPTQSVKWNGERSRLLKNPRSPWMEDPQTWLQLRPASFPSKTKSGRKLARFWIRASTPTCRGWTNTKTRYSDPTKWCSKERRQTAPNSSTTFQPRLSKRCLRWKHKWEAEVWRAFRIHQWQYTMIEMYPDCKVVLNLLRANFSLSLKTTLTQTSLPIWTWHPKPVISLASTIPS